MFYLKYVISELRRRRGRTLVTALGLAVGVGLVVTVNALSAGLDRAQARVLRPLTGVGTDLSVSRPISFSSGAGAGLSTGERRRLVQENGPRPLALTNLGKPGSHFSRDDFVATSQLSFSSSKVSRIRHLSGVASAAGGLTLTSIHVEGKVPKRQQQPQQQFGAGQVAVGPPRNINLSSISVAGVDVRHPGLGAVTPGQVSSGRFFARASAAHEAILDLSYARRKNLGVGDTVHVGGKVFRIVGLARTPLGGQSSDVYLELSRLQQLAGRRGRVNTVYVRATSASAVDDVSREIKSAVSGASVTTAKDLADRVSGSLVDAKNLTGKLGLALEIVGLVAAFLIAALLTIGAVAKRTKELGTLKAVGWSQRLVVRQVTAESVVQGLLGGALGIALGLAGAELVSAVAPSLTATVANAVQATPLPGPFGQGQPTSASTTVHLDAPVSLGLLGLAVLLAVAGGLLAGAAGGLRAARLRPAEALRHLE